MYIFIPQNSWGPATGLVACGSEAGARGGWVARVRIGGTRFGWDGQHVDRRSEGACGRGIGARGPQGRMSGGPAGWVARIGVDRFRHRERRESARPDTERSPTHRARHRERERARRRAQRPSAQSGPIQRAPLALTQRALGSAGTRHRERWSRDRELQGPTQRAPGERQNPTQRPPGPDTESARARHRERLDPTQRVRERWSLTRRARERAGA